MNFIKEVEIARKGVNEGIPGGLPSFDKAVFNTQHGKIIGLIGSPKSGKTAMLIQRYIVYPYLSGADINWVWYSLEMSKNQIAARLASIFSDIHSRELWQKGDIPNRFMISESKILGMGGQRLSDEEFEFLKIINTIYLEPLLGVEDDDGNLVTKGRIEFIEDLSESNPTGINKHLLTLAGKNGTFKYSEYEVKDGDRMVKMKRMVGYTPNTNTKTWVIIDHLGLMRREQGFTKKENIDKLIDEYARGLRNLCGYTFILVSQQNRGIKGIDRMKFTGEQLQPQTEDIKDSSALEETADIIFALFNPNTYLHLKTHLGYDLKDFNGGYRSIHCIASRYTPCPINKSLFFNTNTGRFVELHRAKSPEFDKQMEAIRKIQNGIATTTS